MTVRKQKSRHFFQGDPIVEIAVNALEDVSPSLTTEGQAHIFNEFLDIGATGGGQTKRERRREEENNKKEKEEKIKPFDAIIHSFIHQHTVSLQTQPQTQIPIQRMAVKLHAN